MYFHLIWIKEKNWIKYDLNLLLEWWDEDFIRKFLANRWVVIVSINEYKEDPKSFWNIIVDITYESTNIQLIMPWDNLSEGIAFIISLWLRPSRMNLIENPISDEQMLNIINSTISKVEEEEEKIKKQEEFEDIKERKKYEERGIKDWLKVLNATIDHIEQLLKAGVWVLWWSEIKELENYSSEMKKIRLWTNFNKMASLVLEANNSIKRAEKEILDANAENKFLIDKNSAVTNIDILKEYFYSNSVMWRAKLLPASLTTTELIINTMWLKSVLFKLLRRDLSHSFEKYSFDYFFGITIKLLEFIVIVANITIILFWLIGPLFWMKTSLYLLPAMWWLWLLLYLLQSLRLKWIITSIVWFLILALIYWQWLKLLLNTFAL